MSAMPTPTDEAENQRLWHAKRVEIKLFLRKKGCPTTEENVDQAMLALLGEPNTSPYKFKHTISVAYPNNIVELSKHRFVTSFKVAHLQNQCRPVKKLLWPRIFCEL